MRIRSKITVFTHVFLLRDGRQIPYAEVFANAEADSESV